MALDSDSIIAGKKTLPIGWRLSLHVAGISIILALTVVLSLLPLQYGRVEHESIIEAQILAEAVSTIYLRLGDSQPRDHARRLLSSIARTPYIAFIDVMDPKGIVRYSTDSRELGKQYQPQFGIIREDNELTVTHVVSEPDSSIGAVMVVINRDQMLTEIHRLFAQIGTGLFIMITILSVLVKGLVERLISSRLSKLMHLIENAETGSFLIRAEIDRPDEIGHVILGFNQLLGVITQIEARHLEKEHSYQEVEVQRSMRLKLEQTFYQLERSNERLKSKVQAQELLMEGAHRLGKTLKREAVVEGLVTLVQEKLSWPQFAVFLIEGKEEERHWLKLAASYGLNKESFQNDNKIEIGEGIVGMVAQSGAPVVIGSLANEGRLDLLSFLDRSLPAVKMKKAGSLMAVPLAHKGKVMGVFMFAHPDTGIFDQEDVALISALGAQTALAIINADLYETTLELATSDPLTGVLNRRAMVKQIAYEMARSQRFNIKGALLLADVDHFKAYNDRMGHVLGDVALKAIADVLKENLRKVDTIARFGGEEFCIILPQTDNAAAKEVAKKLCESVRGLSLRGGDKQPLGYLSISIGIAVVSKEDMELEEEDAVTEIIAIADRALYEAKRRGRDRFVDYPF